MIKENILTLHFAGTEYNGWPQIRVRLNDVVVTDCNVVDTLSVDVVIPADDKEYTLIVERYGKTDLNTQVDNGKIVSDQILEIKSLQVDNIDLPNFIIFNHTEFKFNDQVHKGSCYFGPNGEWAFKFKAPIISWILDQKIIHEAEYNKDYQYDWSYKLGPDSVESISVKFADAEKLINQMYDQKS